MEENKEIKVRLSTVICLIIIVVLVIALGGTYYFGFIANKSENVEEEKVINTAENITVLNNNNISNVDSGVKENDTDENKGESENNNTKKDEDIKITKENEKVTDILNRKRNEGTNYEELRVEKISYKNNEYKINLKYSKPITISKKEYKTMKTQGYIKINSEKYNFYNDNEQYENGTVVNKENVEYEVIEYNEKYAFNLTGLAGSGISLLNNNEEIIIDVDKDTKIYDCFEKKEYKLKDREAKGWINKSLEDTLVYLQYDENNDFMIYISNK